MHECFLNDVKEARSRRCVHFLHYNSTRSIIRLALRQLAGRVANRVVGIEELVGLPQADEATMFANGAMKRGKYQKKSAGGTLDDRKIRLRRYERTAILVGLTTGVFAVLGFEAALAIGARWHARWATLLDSSLQRTIAALFVTIPISIAIILAGRAKKKLMGDETAAKEAEFKLRLLAERSGVGWRVPRSAEAADWPKVVVITLVFYIVVFVIAGTICFVFMLIDRWIPSRRDLDKDITPLHAAFLCANVVGVTIPTLFILMAGVFPRVKVTLISEGVLKRYGSIQNLIPYSAIQKVCIVPSPRRRSLNSFAILSTELGFPHWNHFEFGKDAPVDEIIKAFEAKGFAVVAKP